MRRVCIVLFLICVTGRFDRDPSPQSLLADRAASQPLHAARALERGLLREHRRRRGAAAEVPVHLDLTRRLFVFAEQLVRCSQLLGVSTARSRLYRRRFLQVNTHSTKYFSRSTPCAHFFAPLLIQTKFNRENLRIFSTKCRPQLAKVHQSSSNL